MPNGNAKEIPGKNRYLQDLAFENMRSATTTKYWGTSSKKHIAFNSSILLKNKRKNVLRTNRLLSSLTGTNQSRRNKGILLSVS